MKIRVVKAEPKMWYSEMIGELFNVFMIQGFPNYYFSVALFFLPEDVEVVKRGEGSITSINSIGKA